MTKCVYFAWVRERIGVHEEEIEIPNDVKNSNELSESFKFSAAVTAFGLSLRKGKQIPLEAIILLAKEGISKQDKESRDEFLEIVKAYAKL